MILHFTQTLQVANFSMFVIIDLASFAWECFYEEDPHNYHDVFITYNVCWRKPCRPEMAAAGRGKMDQELNRAARLTLYKGQDPLKTWQIIGKGKARNPF